MRIDFERRARLEKACTPKLAWPIRMSRQQAWAVVFAGAGLTGLADLVTGQVAWFGPIYLLLIGIAAWSLGWREGIAVGIGCMVLGFGANGLFLYPHGTAAHWWNMAMRVLAVVLAVVVLHHLRQSYGREWRMARTDQLTGALNRQAFFELAGAASHSRGWNLIVYADLDGLKKHNDLHGHAAGDQSLRIFAQHVMKMIRQDDIFARVGGDEFLIHMQVRDEEAGRAVACRLHGDMNDIFLSNGLPLRCSVGVLMLGPGARSIDREVRAADALMYEAKKLGASLSIAIADEKDGQLAIRRRWEQAPAISGGDLIEIAPGELIADVSGPSPRNRPVTRTSTDGREWSAT